MSVLARWLPFMFKRKGAEEKKSEPKSTGLERAQGRAELMWPPAPLTQWMRPFFDDPFFTEPRGAFGDLDRWFGDFAPTRFAPSVDVTDEADTLKVTAELPGMDKSDIDLSVENGCLRIRGEKRHEEEKKERGVYRTERYYGYVNRTIPLPDDVDQEQVDAAFEKGVLTVRFPKRKTEPEHGRKIAIKGG